MSGHPNQPELEKILRCLGVEVPHLAVVLAAAPRKLAGLVAGAVDVRLGPGVRIGDG